VKIKNYTTKYLKNISDSYFLNITFICFSILIIFFSTYFSAYADYFWMDYIYAQFSHNQNNLKNIFEILPNSYNAIGIPVWILEPILNPLSNFAYNITNKQEYIFYLSLLRFLEILTLLIFLFSFSKNIKIIDFSILIFLYLILLVNFNRYDHEPYMNFPMLIFCAIHALSLKVKNNFLFFTLLIFGNAWAYLINPIIFFLVCFLPLVFFYIYFLYNKEYKKLFLAFLANLPFTICFILISFGNSRFALSEFFTGAMQHHNFALFESKNYLILATLFFSIAILNFKKNAFYSLFFIVFTILTVLFGLFFYFDPQAWKLPSPYQIEYALQFIIIFVFYKIFKSFRNNKFFIPFFLILIILFTYRSIFFTEKYFELKDLRVDDKFYDQKKNMPKMYYWSGTEDKFFFDDDLKLKRIFLYLPNKYSAFYESYIDKDINNPLLMEDLSLKYNNNFKGSLIYTNFWENNFIVDQGYSFNLDINSVLANYFNPSKIEIYDDKNVKKKIVHLSSNRVLRYLQVPKIDIKNKLINFYQFEFILTDIQLNDVYNHRFVLNKIFKFNGFNLYLYKVINESQDYNIKKINIINNYSNFQKNINKFKNELFISNQELNNVRDIKNFCKVNIIHENNKIAFNVTLINSDQCIAIFPLPFSNTNIFENKSDKNKKCKSFKVQYYYHGCLISRNEKYVLKKNNIFLYPFNSIKDYIEFKKIKAEIRNIN